MDKFRNIQLKGKLLLIKNIKLLERCNKSNKKMKIKKYILCNKMIQKELNMDCNKNGIKLINNIKI